MPVAGIRSTLRPLMQIGVGFLQSLIVNSFVQVLQLPHWSVTLKVIRCVPSG